MVDKDLLTDLIGDLQRYDMTVVKDMEGDYARPYKVMRGEWIKAEDVDEMRRKIVAFPLK